MVRCCSSIVAGFRFWFVFSSSLRRGSGSEVWFCSIVLNGSEVRVQRFDFEFVFWFEYILYPPKDSKR